MTTTGSRACGARRPGSSSNARRPDPSDPVGTLRAIRKSTFKRALFGYRRAEVDDAIAARDSALDSLAEELAQADGERKELERERDELERVATALSERVVARERELKELRDELARSRSETSEALRSLSVVAGELEAVRAQARGQATRIRMRALRDAAEIADRVADMTGEPGQSRERLLASLAQAVERLGVTEERWDEPAPAEPVGPTVREDSSIGEGDAADAGENASAPEPEPSAEPAPAASAGEGAMANGAAANGNGYHAGRSAAEIFEGLVEVEVGPLADFAQLVGFEDAASEIGGTSEISVKRFAKGRATLEMRLGRPVELLRELEERAPFDFVVRDTRDDKLILDVEGEGD